MSYKILITDTASALGCALEHDLEREHCKLYAPGPDQLNWLDSGAVIDYLASLRPDVVINTLGWDNILTSEQQIVFPRVAANLALACAPLAIPLLHFSSYKVFGVDSKNSHSEKDIPAPVSAVGQAFFAAEQAIEHSSAKAIILRLGWVIGSYGDNHLTRLLNSIQTQQPVFLNVRLRGAPTLLSDVVRVVVALIKQVASGAENWGVMHYCSGDAVNEAEFGEQLVQLLAQQQLLSTDANFTLLDEAPLDEPVSAVLGCRRIRDGFGVQARSWRPSLLPLVKQWFHQQNNQP
ncbi:MAG TPA: sugar nucleotide-binding protein [Cellvibrio sp.]|nr:sugar nucleotide-binding protein [Cellvibrio sp.]